MSIAYSIKKGMPYPMGVTASGQAINIAVEFPHSPREECGIVLYSASRETMRIPFSEECRVGLLYCVCLENIQSRSFSYRFYIDGEYFCDPYARGVTGRDRWANTRHKAAEIYGIYSAGEDFDWENDRCLEIPYEESVIYGLHVRGFTKHISSGVSERGTFEGITEKIAYLQELGITAVECMPFYEFDEIIWNTAALTEESSKLSPAEFMGESATWKYRINYWGLREEGNYYFAPKRAYAASGNGAFSCKTMIKALHKAGIECIMQIYFPIVYDSGFISQVLRFWVMEYHVDGFHLMGMELPMGLLAKDPVLKRTKLYCQKPMTDSVYAHAAQVPEFRNLACYREDFQTDMRRFLKGDEDMLYRVSEHVRSNSRWEGRIHHMADYSGFTMMDMVSYDRKHNENNGEDNRDGNDYNYSWNCGVEGPSRKGTIQNLRLTQRKNAMAFLFLSQGTPFILAGDEFGHSAGGNNNAYCQDNKVNWLDWKFDKRGQELFSFTKLLISFRKKHPILHAKNPMQLMDYKACGYPDISFHGEQAWYAGFENYNRHLGVMYCGLYEKKKDCTSDDFLYIAYNMHWLAHEFALPILPRNYAWCIQFGTVEGLPESIEDVTFKAASDREETIDEIQKKISVPPRSVLVLTGKRWNEKRDVPKSRNKVKKNCSQNRKP